MRECPICDFPPAQLDELLRRQADHQLTPALARGFANRVCDFAQSPARAREWLLAANCDNRARGEAIRHLWEGERFTWTPLEAQAAKVVIMAADAAKVEVLAVCVDQTIRTAAAAREAAEAAGTSAEAEYDWQIAYARDALCTCALVLEASPESRLRISLLAS